MTDPVIYLNPPNARPLLGLYSHVARIQPGEMAYIAGQVATDASGAPAGVGDLKVQFRSVFEGLGIILNDLGTDFDSVAKFTTYLVNSEDIPAFMEVRKEVFPSLFKGPLYPPNTLLIVDRLVREEFLVEVEAVVRLPG